jgi:hypothetical protein
MLERNAIAAINTLFAPEKDRHSRRLPLRLRGLQAKYGAAASIANN